MLGWILTGVAFFVFFAVMFYLGHKQLNED